MKDLSDLVQRQKHLHKKKAKKHKKKKIQKQYDLLEHIQTLCNTTEVKPILVHINEMNKSFENSNIKSQLDLCKEMSIYNTNN